MIYDVFISYSTNDQKVVEGLSAYLEKKGIRCFVAYRDIPKGIDWAEAITTAIENCRLMIVVFSEHINRSKQVDREISICIEEGKPILTFKIQNVTLTGTKKYYLQNLNWIDAFPNPEKCFGKLCENIQLLIPEIYKKEEEAPESPPEKTKKLKKYPQYLYYALGGIAIIALFCWLTIQYNKFGDNLKDISTNENDSIEQLLHENISDSTKVMSEKSVIINPTEKKDEISKNSEEEAPVKLKNNYEEEGILISEWGEQYHVNKGDVFEGEMKNGKIVQGKLMDKDGNVKHLIIPKRNH